MKTININNVKMQCSRRTEFIFRIFLYFLFIFVSFHIQISSFTVTDKAFGQTHFSSDDNPGFRIDKIVLSGNKRTKDYIILREMLLKEGDTASEEDIIRDRKRIRNTNLFEYVKIERIDQNGTNILKVYLTERMHVFPFPIFDFKENDFGKLSWGGGFSHFNLRGRNERFMVIATGGYNPSFETKYINPWFYDEKQMFCSLNIQYKKYESKTLRLDKFNDTRKKIYGELGKRFGLFTYFSCQASYQTIKVTGDPLGKVISNTGIDKILMLRTVFKYDYRDFRRYPSRGTVTEFWLTHYNIINTDIMFNRFGVRLKKFLPLRDFATIAAQVHTDLSTGDIPSYGRVYYGFGNRIRGYYERILEGDNILGGNIEIRIPFMKLKHYTWQNAPFAKKLFRDLEFGAGISFFTDAGQVWDSGSKPGLKRIFSGKGIGIHFMLPYDSIIRFEYSLNDNSDTEFIIDGGLAF